MSERQDHGFFLLYDGTTIVCAGATRQDIAAGEKQYCRAARNIGFPRSPRRLIVWLPYDIHPRWAGDSDFWAKVKRHADDERRQAALARAKARQARQAAAS